MYRLGVAITLLATACGRKGDECQRFWDKASPVMAKVDGKEIPASAKATFLDNCHKNPRSKQDPMFRCVLDASGEQGVKDCMTKTFGDYQAASKQIEAKLVLKRIGLSAKTHFATEGLFPAGKAGPTPAEPCCKAQGGQCAPNAQQWAASDVWTKLAMTGDEPMRFQYTYESDGVTVTATAIGDLDCDGTPITYKLTMAVSAKGEPTFDIAEPAPNSD